MLNRPKRVGRLFAFAVVTSIIIIVPAYAAGSGMPWEAPLEQVVDSVTGPVARAAAVIAIVLTGLGVAFAESGGGMRKLMIVALGISIAFAAASFFLTFFGFAGGAVL